MDEEETAEDRLRRELQETEWLVGRLSHLLTETANALKGQPGPLRLHDWSDLPTVARTLVAELNNRKVPTPPAGNESVEEALAEEICAMAHHRDTVYSGGHCDGCMTIALFGKRLMLGATDGD